MPCLSTSFRDLPRIVLVFGCGVLSVTGLSAADLSGYRGFRLGMTLQAFGELAKVDVSHVQVVHRKPALLQQTNWYPELSSEPAQPDPVRSGVFSFYDGALYRVLISYDDSKTEGLTAEDLTNSLAAIYGAAAHPNAVITVTAEGIEESATVLAQWEDADSLLRLIRIAYRGRVALLLTESVSTPWQNWRR